MGVRAGHRALPQDGLRAYSRASVAAGLSPWSTADVTAPAPLRLYRAVATEISLLDATTGQGRDERVVVEGQARPSRHGG